MFDEDIVKLVNKWAASGPIGLQPALRICRELIFFNPDPREKEKKPRPCIFILQDGKAKIVFVKTGIQDNEYIEIIDGLKEKDEVISSPYGAISKQLYHKAEVKKVDKDKLFKVEVK